MEAKFELITECNDFDLVCVSGEWHCLGFAVIKRGGQYYIQNSELRKANKGLPIHKADFLKELYGYFDYPTKEQMSKMYRFEWVKIAEANHEFIRSLYLTAYWFDSGKRLAKILQDEK